MACTADQAGEILKKLAAPASGLDAGMISFILAVVTVVEDDDGTGGQVVLAGQAGGYGHFKKLL